MQPLLDWGIQHIQWIQSGLNPVLILFLKLVSALGEESFYLLAIAWITWGIDRRFGLKLCGVILVSFYLNTLLKDLGAQPRPFDLVPALALAKGSGPGLPSGHAQSVVVFWGLIAHRFRSRLTLGIALFLPVLMGISRIGLGVHFPTDVFAGWLIGAVILAVATRVPDQRAAAFTRLHSVFVVIALCGVLGLLHWTPDTAKILGATLGLTFGTALDAASPPRRSIKKAIVGVFALGLAYLVLSALLGPLEHEAPVEVAQWMRLIRYAALGCLIGGDVPLRFFGDARVGAAAPSR